MSMDDFATMHGCLEKEYANIARENGEYSLYSLKYHVLWT